FEVKASRSAVGKLMGRLSGITASESGGENVFCACSADCGSGGVWDFPGESSCADSNSILRRIRGRAELVDVVDTGSPRYCLVPCKYRLFRVEWLTNTSERIARKSMMSGYR